MVYAQTTAYRARPLLDRILALEKEISGVKSMYQITQFDLDLMKSMKPLTHGSPKQRAALNQIEIKVFGYSREDAAVQ